MHAHTTTAPTQRPADFDAMLVRYMPGMRKMASRLGFTGDEADYLVLDTIARCLANWRNYRPGPSAWSYLYWTMRGVTSRRKRELANRNRLFVHDPDGRHAAGLALAPTQEHAVDLKRAVEALDSRGGHIAVRVAMGETFEEVGSSIGVSRQRAKQLSDRAVARVAGLRVAA